MVRAVVRVRILVQQSYRPILFHPTIFRNEIGPPASGFTSPLVSNFEFCARSKALEFVKLIELQAIAILNIEHRKDTFMAWVATEVIPLSNDEKVETSFTFFPRSVFLKFFNEMYRSIKTRF